MEELFSQSMKAIFPENMLLAFFLGMCSFLACSNKMETAHGLGLAVIFVLTITCTMNWIILNFVLEPGILNGYKDLTYLGFLCYIATIAATVQFLEIFIDKFAPALYMSLGIFLPLISVNCAILGASLFMVDRDYTIVAAVNFSFSSGVGWYLAIISLAAIREKLRYSNVPAPLKGIGITFMITGLMAFCFMTFAGL
ncbi:MAG: NADH:ubiquinone reductase (Na(+)-transporting) subunit E [Planctomycetota bacterium]|nr:MAG: NADH:ubiquinone reductase (Na(+)-transporting) subunit E [Planctomycetota bacterium]